MDKPEFSCAILSKLKLDDVEKVVKEATTTRMIRAGRPGNRWASSKR